MTTTEGESASKPAQVASLSAARRNKILKGLSAAELKKYKAAEAEAKEKVWEASCEVDEVDGKIDKLRERYSKQLTEAKKAFKGAIHATHNNTKEQKAAIHDRTYDAWIEWEKIGEAKAKALEPLLSKRREMITRRRNAHESVDQYILDFGSDGVT